MAAERWDGPPGAEASGADLIFVGGGDQVIVFLLPARDLVQNSPVDDIFGWSEFVATAEILKIFGKLFLLQRTITIDMIIAEKVNKVPLIASHLNSGEEVDDSLQFDDLQDVCLTVKPAFDLSVIVPAFSAGRVPGLVAAAAATALEHEKVEAPVARPEEVRLPVLQFLFHLFLVIFVAANPLIMILRVQVATHLIAELKSLELPDKHTH